MSTSQERIASFSAALVEAHRQRCTLSIAGLVELVDRDEALAVQARVMDELGADVGGWKIWLRPDGAIPAPMYRTVMQAEGAAHRWAPDRFLAIELEIAFQLSRDIRPRPDRAYSEEEVYDAIAAAVVGIEIVEPRLIEFRQAPYLSFVADNIGNGGFVVGSETSQWRALDLGRLSNTVTRDGAVIHTGVGGHASGNPLVPLLAYVNAQTDIMGGLQVGQVVTTGTVCGLISLDGPCIIEGTIEGLGSVRLEITD